MMTRILLLAIAGLFAGAAGVGTAGDDTPKVSKEVQDELKRLDGEWRVVAAEVDGEPFESKLVLRFAGGKCTSSDPGSGLPDWETTIALDPAKAPKRMDMTNPKLKTTHRGIYELKGDSLKVVYQIDQKGDRPTEFQTKKGSGLAMFTLERVKPK